MRKTISTEQERAILARKGVVLKAGAGAGKTFVIVEHFVDIVKERINEDEETDPAEFLSKIVVITFTRKAARELRSRIELRIRELSRNEQLWLKVEENLKRCFIGTIHSFCFSVLKSIPVLDFSSFELVNESLINQKIKYFVLEWIKKDSSILKEYEIKEIIFSLERIFSDAELRFKWDNFLASEKLDTYCDDFFSLYEVAISSDLNEGEGTKWRYFLDEYKIITSGKNNLKKINDLSTFFRNTKRIPTPSKKTVSENITDAFRIIKELKPLALEFQESLDNYNSDVKTRSEKLKSLYNHISKHYYDDSKISFTDLEYLLIKYKKIIDLKIDKMIVDEFQDVSNIQSQIFEIILKNDFSKLYAVGDAKQAIYGFRGGEKSVFKNLEIKVEGHYSLKDNYRSAPEVVEFNNILFKRTFSIDSFQRSQSKLKGKVELNKYTIPSELLSENLRELEAEVLFQYLVEELKTDRKEIAILYKYLNSGKMLINLLRESNIGFKCSLRIEKSNDPILSIFIQILNYIVGKQNLEASLFFIEGYLTYLNCEPGRAKKGLLDFQSSFKNFGLNFSWLSFLSYCGLSHGYPELTLGQLNNLMNYFFNNPALILSAINESLDERIIIDVSEGYDKKKISLMTAHSSKGLEFDEVIVAGIMTNSRGKNDRIVIGETPHSFSYKKEGKRFLTPSFLLERRKNKIKNDDESTRLFYVACTRAKKKLSFLLIDNKFDKIQKNSWAEFLLENIEECSSLEVNRCNFQLTNSQFSKRPDYQMLNFTIQNIKEPAVIGLMPEISVSRLSTIVKCPRKFFYSEVVGLDEDDFEKVNQSKSTQQIISSAERGSRIHEEISKFIKTGKTFPDKLFGFIEKLFKPYSNFKFVSEIEMKFSIDGKMMSGTPDLILENSETLEVWDFKTGSRNEEKDEIYQVQAALYLYGIFQNNQAHYKEIKSKIIYLDLETTLEKSYGSYEALELEVLKVMELCYGYDQKISINCDTCSFRSICLSEELLSGTDQS